MAIQQLSSRTTRESITATESHEPDTIMAIMQKGLNSLDENSRSTWSTPKMATSMPCIFRNFFLSFRHWGRPLEMGPEPWDVKGTTVEIVSSSNRHMVLYGNPSL